MNCTDKDAHRTVEYNRAHVAKQNSTRPKSPHVYPWQYSTLTLTGNTYLESSVLCVVLPSHHRTATSLTSSDEESANVLAAAAPAPSAMVSTSWLSTMPTGATFADAPGVEAANAHASRAAARIASRLFCRRAAASTAANQIERIAGEIPTICTQVGRDWANRK